MKSRAAASILLMLPVMLLLCGFLFNTVTVMVDTEKNQVYEYASADDILSDFGRDQDAAEKKYKGGYYIVSGRVESISSRGGTVMMVGPSVTDDRIICECPRSLRSEALTYSAGSGLCVYGRITVDLFDKEIHIQAQKLAPSGTAAKKGMYYLIDGSSIDKSRMITRTLQDGNVRYMIPAAWKGAEHSIKDDKLGSIEGYQYVLNKLPGNTDTVPESFFVCYFDNENLAISDDRKETKLIERAVIDNICGKGSADSFRSRDVTTYYGARYNYYVGDYTDKMNNGYHVEFIFQKNGDDGLVMYLYVYKNARHLSDVMFVTRFLEIRQQAESRRRS
ncbi:MAG TPA: hypothetical protein DCL38_08750 [Lachnospiraceae bacterium]|nr:hypothetical protein [Lachnospiraceae bacterium]